MHAESTARLRMVEVMAGQSNGDCRRKQQPNIEAGLPYPFGDGYRDPPHQAALYPNKLRAKSSGRGVVKARLERPATGIAVHEHNHASACGICTCVFEIGLFLVAKLF